MVIYRFGTEDVLRTRFAISPLMEISGGYEALRDPARVPVHAPWAAWAAPRVAALELDVLDALIPHRARWYPDFVTPPPLVPHAELAAELERVRRVPAAQVRAEVHRAYEGKHMPPAARRVVEDPRAGLRELARQMRAFWDAALAPRWDAILGLLEREIAWRARRLAAVGPQAAFAGIGDEVRWAGDRLEVGSRVPVDVDLAGRGLLFVPAVFAWPAVWPLSDPPWQPAVVYAPRGVAELWAPQTPDPAALEDLLGRRRAAVLLALERPRSTAELAARLHASAAGTSEHLGVLRRAGLVAGRREGRAVLYARTAAGETLVRASATSARPS